MQCTVSKRSMSMFSLVSCVVLYEDTGACRDIKGFFREFPERKDFMILKTLKISPEMAFVKE